MKDVKVMNSRIRTAILGSTNCGTLVKPEFVKNLAKAYFQATHVHMSDEQIDYLETLSKSQAFNVFKAINC